MRSIQLNHEISKNVFNLGSGAWKPHLGCIGTTMFGCSIRVKSHIGTTPCWELWGNLVLCHPLDSISMSLAKVDFGNQSAWIPAICVNTVSTTLSTLFAMTPAKLIKSWYAVSALLLYWVFLYSWILLFLKLSSCSFNNSFSFSRNLACSFRFSNFNKNEG